jgi:endonuclease/exonuclease/phosphatase family metal-dependent hydrolase
VAYHDTGSSNAGGAYRSTGVDIENSSEGGYDVGWTASGEWLMYTVNVASSASYTVQLRVASPYGATMHVGFDGSTDVWKAVSIPNTGGWQRWTTVSFTTTIGSGKQMMKVYFDNGAVNFNKVTVASATTTTTTTPTTSSGTGADISVLSWNIRINDYSEAHARAAMARAMAVSPRPQVITIQEAYRTRFDIYIDELQRQTGRTWYGVFRPTCPLGAWNGSTCSVTDDGGIGIFSMFPITSSSIIWLPYPDCWTSARVALRAAISVNGKTVQVFNTHLQTGSCSSVADQRYASMRKIKDWAKSYSTPQIIGGDFNADPDQIMSSSGMSPNFVDSWTVAGVGNRFTFTAPYPSMKIDYLMFDAGWGAQPLSSEVPTSTGGVSDHYPVRATFRIR